MNKTSIETTLPCGCVERRWLFGRALIRRCVEHMWRAPDPPTKTWEGGPRD